MPHSVRWHAIIVGVGTYKDPAIPGMPVAAREAEQVADALRDSHGAAYFPSLVQLLTDIQATKPNLVSALKTSSQQASSEDSACARQHSMLSRHKS